MQVTFFLINSAFPLLEKLTDMLAFNSGCTERQLMYIRSLIFVILSPERSSFWNKKSLSFKELCQANFLKFMTGKENYRIDNAK